MKKNRLHSAARCHSVFENSIWFIRIAPFLLLLLVPGTQSEFYRRGNGIDEPTSYVPSSLRNSQVCEGFRCGSSECVEFDQVCDNVKNCADGSDENLAACINRTCDPGTHQLNSILMSWRCDNGECISNSYLCDGQANCGDASDETESACFHRREIQDAYDYGRAIGEHLSRKFLLCVSGEMISDGYRCDGRADCEDASDEMKFACMDLRRELHPYVYGQVVGYQLSSKFWLCDNGKWVSDVYRCDGEDNCGDASDETKIACVDQRCTRAQFTCKTGQCIQKGDLCDSKKHCFDGTDEHWETCLDFSRNRTREICLSSGRNYCADRTQCYLKRQHCDGEVNCFDGSDEDPETCGFTEAPTPPTIPVPAGTTPAPPAPTPFDSGEVAPDTPEVVFPDSGTRMWCSVERLSEDIKVDILTCGGQGLQHECVSAGMVPFLTVVLADCWSAASIVLRCHSDGTWGEYGVETTAAERMWHICQPRHINSQVCGRKPRYKSTGKTLYLHQFFAPRNLHPWLVGLKRWGRYECSATLITSTWLITAAHCVVRNQARNNETIDPRNLKVQLDSWPINDQFVNEIRVHPQFEPASRLLNDIALIRLEEPLLLNGTRYPACVDLNLDGFLTPSYAMTFSRPNGENEHRYEKVLQEVDNACYYRPLSRCHPLQINPTQFCGSDIEKEKHLIGGSSGGPFMQNLGSDYTESWAVSGIVSTEVKVKGCELPFTIYTAVHNYKNWIQEVITSDSLF